MISLVQFICLKLVQRPQRGIDIQNKLVEAKIIKGYKYGFSCIYALKEKGLCRVNTEGKWEITEDGKNLVKSIESIESNLLKDCREEADF